MPGMGHLSDAEIAAILTYATNSWGNEASAFSVEEVAKVRSDTGLEDRAAGERHPGASEGEMRYQGTPSPIPAEQTRAVQSPEGPTLSAEEYATSTRLYFERCAGCHGVLRKGATGKPLTPGYHAAERHRLPEGADHLWLTGRHAELGHVGRTQRV